MKRDELLKSIRGMAAIMDDRESPGTAPLYRVLVEGANRQGKPNWSGADQVLGADGLFVAWTQEDAQADPEDIRPIFSLTEVRRLAEWGHLRSDFLLEEPDASGRFLEGDRQAGWYAVKEPLIIPSFSSEDGWPLLYNVGRFWRWRVVDRTIDPPLPGVTHASLSNQFWVAPHPREETLWRQFQAQRVQFDDDMAWERSLQMYRAILQDAVQFTANIRPGDAKLATWLTEDHFGRLD